jgi:GPH family glycoside/pentoside/hexuronide:cation symporter
MPYYSLQMELTPNYDERTRISAWLAVFGKFANLAGGWTLAIIAGPWFLNAATGKPDIVRGMQSVSWVIAGSILCLGVLPAIFVRERYYEAETSRQAKDPFWQSLKESFHCKPLWQLIGISFFVALGSASIGTLGQYVNIYFVNNGRLGDASIITGWKATVAVVTGLLSIPLWTWLSEKFDKKIIVCVLILGGMGGHALNYFCLRPDMPYLQLIPAVFQSGILGALSLLIPSMKGDIADYDELQTARRREGSLNAFYSWFLRMSQTCAMGAGGLVLALSGFDVVLPEQPPEVLSRMKFLYLGLPIVIWSVSLVFVWRYPLTRVRMAGIRADLEARRGRI